jgi:transcriptional regulator with XRE-family HTH domain
MQGLGNYVRGRRAELGLTQEELAARIGGSATQAEISRLERGMVALPRRSRLEALAAALEVTLGSLLVHSGWLTSDEMAELDEPPQPQLEASATEDLLADIAHLRETLFTAIERLRGVEATIRASTDPPQRPHINAPTGGADDRETADRLNAETEPSLSRHPGW